MYLVGDMNINILNYENHTDTNGFLDLMYSKGMYPVITRPTRITKTSSTLIDNIFINEYIHRKKYIRRKKWHTYF